MDDTISRQAAIDTDGLDEEIRCEMCVNPMRTNRGCDGHCKYDEKLYEKIIQILGERIKPLPSAQPEQFVDADKLKRCRFEYINACKILAHRTPDTRKKDIDDAHAVIRALHPIFGDAEF